MPSAHPEQAPPFSIDYQHAPPSRWTLICHPGDPRKSLVRVNSEPVHPGDARRVHLHLAGPAQILVEVPR